MPVSYNKILNSVYGFGLNFEAVTNYLTDTDNGPPVSGVINLVESGFNSGWVLIEGTRNVKFNSTEEGDRKDSRQKSQVILWFLTGRANIVFQSLFGIILLVQPR
jgi:hypothetical protein